MLRNSCGKWSIKINGNVKLFNSDMELDSFIKSKFSNTTIKVDKSFSFTNLSNDTHQETLDKLKNIKDNSPKSIKQKTIDDGLGEPDIDIIPQKSTISVSQAISALGFVTDLDINSWRITEKPRMIEQFLKECEKDKSLNPEDAESYADSIIKLKEESWPYLTSYGTQAHYIAEQLILNEPLTYESFKNHFKKEESIFSEQIFNITKKNIYSFITDLKNSGTNVELIPELDVLSNNLGNDAKQILQEKGKDTIAGRIDLVAVVDGKVKIYDFKVSRKEVGEWQNLDNYVKMPFSEKFESRKGWHSSKKVKTAAQLQMYKKLLIQNGIDKDQIDALNIEPIKLDINYKTVNINGLDVPGIVIDMDNPISNVLLTGTITNQKYLRNEGFIYDKVHKTFVTDSVDASNTSDLLKSTVSEMSKLFPTFTVLEKIHGRNYTVDFIAESKIKKVGPNDKTDVQNARFKFWANGKWNYAKNKSELIPLVEQYVVSENEKRNNILIDLGNAILMSQKSDSKDFGKMFIDDQNKDILLHKNIIPLIKNGWQLWENPELWSMGLFIFKKNDTVEIVCISNGILTQEFKLERGNTIVGNYKKDSDVDTKRLLPSNYGSIELMKVATFINNNSELFKNVNISNISVLSIFSNTNAFTNPTIDEIFDSYKELILLHNQKSENTIRYNLKKIKTLSVFDQVMLKIDDVLSPETKQNWHIERFKGDTIPESQITSEQITYLEEILNKIISRNYRDININDLNYSDEIQRLVAEIGSAISILSGFTVKLEADKAEFLSVKGGLHAGMRVTAWEFSSSKNIQEMWRLLATVKSNLSEEKNRVYNPIQNKLRETYKKSGYYRAIGGEDSMFRSWFVRNDDGSLDDRFIVKNPDDPSIPAEQKELMKMMLDTFYLYRFNRPPTESDRNTDEYYQIPLLRGNFKTRVLQQGLKRATIDSFKSLASEFDMDPDWWTDKKAKSQNKMKIYNPFRLMDTNRANKIANKGVDYFETNLELVLMQFLDAYINEDIYNRALPLIQGFKMQLELQAWLATGESPDISIKRILEVMDDLLKISVYDEPLMKEELKAWKSASNIIANVSSTLALGFNPIAGVREHVQGIFTNISRSAVNLYGKDKFGAKHYAQAWAICTVDATKYGAITLLDKLNWKTNFVNAPAHELIKKRRDNKLGILNGTSDLKYYFIQSPDVFNRLTILIAQMLKDDSFKALSLNENDELVYDWKKDGRFSVYVSGDTTHKNYKFQRQLYLEYLKQFNKERKLNLKEGDDLPFAYPMRELSGLKSFADFCFGHYDKDQQAAIKFTFFGSLFLQFRTFYTSKFEQWILKPGTYNQEYLKQQVDENGKRLVIMTDENGEESIVTEDDSRLTDSNWVPYMGWTGSPLEGIAWTIFGFGKMLFKNPKEISKTWKDNPQKQANVKLFLHDMVWMMIWMYIIQLIFKDFADSGPITKGTAKILYNVADDFNIFNVVSSMGNLNPPTWVMMQSTIKNFTRMFTSDNKTNALLSLWGPTRIFKDTFNPFM